MWEIPNEGTMLIRYSCRDMGLGCSFVVKGETLDEVTREAMQHVQDKHAQDFNKMQSEVEIQRMELAIRKSTRVVAE